jgi:hypothetical protein
VIISPKTIRNPPADDHYDHTRIEKVPRIGLDTPRFRPFVFYPQSIWLTRRRRIALTTAQEVDTNRTHHLNLAEVAVPPGAPSWISAELIADTLRIWQPYYAETLTPIDALDMILNVSRLVDVICADQN